MMIDLSGRAGCDGEWHRISTYTFSNDHTINKISITTPPGRHHVVVTTSGYPDIERHVECVGRSNFTFTDLRMSVEPGDTATVRVRSDSGGCDSFYNISAHTDMGISDYGGCVDDYMIASQIDGDYTCSVCDETFTSVEDRNEHIKSEHSL